MKSILINLLLKLAPKLLVDLFDKYEEVLKNWVESTEIELDDKLFAALKTAIDALR
jgi:hypothetical protein